jgi:hypothetical protein
MEVLLAHPEYKTVEYIVSPDYVIRCTRRFKRVKLRGKELYHEDILVSMGQPNYLARPFIKACQKAGEPFPIKRLRTKLFPKKKAKK